MEFLKNFKKELATVKGVTTTSLPPRYWYSTGNLVLNYILSGYFDRGIPQGRITNFCGPSGCLPAGEEVEVYEMQTLDWNVTVDDKTKVHI